MYSSDVLVSSVSSPVGMSLQARTGKDFTTQDLVLRRLGVGLGAGASTSRCRGFLALCNSRLARRKYRFSLQRLLTTKAATCTHYHSKPCICVDKIVIELNNLEGLWALPKVIGLEKTGGPLGVPDSEGERRNPHRPRWILQYKACQHGKPRHHTHVGALAPFKRGTFK